MAAIVKVDFEYFRVPLEETLVDAKHGDHTHFELITCALATADGLEGIGYTYTGGLGGRAILALLRYDLGPYLLGRDADGIEALWNDLQWRVHYVARGGIASFAISAVDIALWDIRGRKSGLPLWKMAGGGGRTARVYAGGIDLDFGLEKLLANTRRYLGSGFRGVKIKVGRERLSDDFDRALAVREVLGRENVFMVDANMVWPVDTAIKAARFFRKETGALWLEEPTVPDDHQGYERIGREGGLAIGSGENLHTIFEFRQAIEVGRIAYPIIDAGNIGGVTGFLKVAGLAGAHNLPACSHGMQELHVSLVAGVANPGWVEAHSFPIDRYTARPLVLEGGMGVAPDAPGTGVEFRRGLLEPYKEIPF
ncbi:MAG: mandelate racemase/muconate lactonizing enzyme family protein [Planctomycetota bacterium]|jgi:L-alanine-DL-glutamate epimerase-like enolase superfamily enzyme|nr:mandelate racemase/muconate lactonizing enzyme family protein [Planctomycetota bacterium]